MHTYMPDQQQNADTDADMDRCKSALTKLPVTPMTGKHLKIMVTTCKAVWPHSLC